MPRQAAETSGLAACAPGVTLRPRLLSIRLRWAWVLALPGEMFGVKPIVDWEVLFHVGEEDGDIDNIVPACAGVFQHELDVFKYGAALLLDVVTSDITRRIERDAGNFFAPAHPRSDARKEEKIANSLGVRKCAHRFGRAGTFERLAHGAACDDFVARALMN